MTVMTGVLRDYPIAEDAPDYKGSITIEWPPVAARQLANGPKVPPQRLIPGSLIVVRDERDGAMIPCAGVTIHAQASGFITADVAVFLDGQGEIIRDPNVIWRDSDGIPATFPFLVAEMRVGRGD